MRKHVWLARATLDIVTCSYNEIHGSGRNPITHGELNR